MDFSDFLEGKKGEGAAPGAGDAYSWVRVRLPDGRDGFVASRDVTLFPFKEDLPLPLPLRSPSDWIAFGKRFLGAPYTWGGTTPLGFDCSGLIARIFSEHGVTLRRNSYEQAFQDPQLVPVAFEKLRPGDLLFFGTEDKIDHEAMWIGDGTVLQATRHNVPGVQVTPYDSPFLKPLFRYARRLRKEEEKISSKGEEGRRAAPRRDEGGRASGHTRRNFPRQRRAVRDLVQGPLQRSFTFSELFSFDARRLHDEDARPPRAPPARRRRHPEADRRAAREERVQEPRRRVAVLDRPRGQRRPDRRVPREDRARSGSSRGR